MTLPIDQIICGDCLEVMPGLPDGCADMILADPPYGTTACKWDSVIPLEPMWKQLKRIIKSNGAIVMTASQPFTTTLIASNMKMFHCEWIWYKSKPSGIAFKFQPMRNHESILVFGNVETFNGILEEREGFTEKSIKRFTSKQNLGTYRNHGNSTTGIGCNKLKAITRQRKPTTIKKFASIPNRLGTFHPTQKPVSLMEYLIKTYTNEGELVLDFTCGSGTTCKAAQNLGRRFIGIDISEEYCDISRRRLKGIKLTLFEKSKKKKVRNSLGLTK